MSKSFFFFFPLKLRYNTFSLQLSSWQLSWGQLVRDISVSSYSPPLHGVPLPEELENKAIISFPWPPRLWLMGCKGAQPPRSPSAFTWRTDFRVETSCGGCKPRHSCDAWGLTQSGGNRDSQQLGEAASMMLFH